MFGKFEKSTNKPTFATSGMSRVVFWGCCVPMILCTFLSTTLATEEEVPPSSAQDALILASLQQASDGPSNELRKAASMYELLQLAALQQQQRQRLLDLEEKELEEAEELPVALPLQGKLMPLPPDDYIKDKRGSYMSLCHFKICNMGRKRNPYWNTWGRTQVLQ